MSKIYVPPSYGKIAIGRMDAHGRIHDVSHRKNTVVYEGVDLLAQIFAGTQSLRINTVYMEFFNGAGAPPAVTVDPTEGRVYYETLEAAPGTQDYLRVPVVATPTLSSSDEEKFSNNVVSFFAVSSALVGQKGLAFDSASNSQVYGVALVCATDIEDPTYDIVFSRSYGFTPKAKDDNHQISIWWSHIFGEDTLLS